MNNRDFEAIINNVLSANLFQDYAPNGLQIEGKSEIKNVVTGVTACQRLIDEAVRLKADAILVHHGYFWKNESPIITGMKYNRIKTLINHDINLYGYHLPLDAHPTLGNNAQLAKQLDLSGTIFSQENEILYRIEVSEPISSNDLSNRIQQTLNHLVIFSGELNMPKKIEKVAICTGGGQDFIDEAILKGCDAFITGEVSERTIHIARENGIYFYAAGHHATERYGIKALGDYLSEHYALNVTFVDIDNPA